MSSVKGGDVYTRIMEALDSANNQQYGVDSNKVGNSYPCSYLWAYPCQAELSIPTVNAPDPTASFPTGNESQIISGLISNCIATVLMIQVRTS